MEETIVKAMERTEAPKKVRKNGYTPGVLNNADTSSTSVQFDTIALNKIIATHGSNAKLWIESNTKKEFGIMTEVQRDPVSHQVLHVSVLLMKQDHEVTMTLPIHFEGKDELEHRNKMVLINKMDIQVSGKAVSIPDSVTADITNKDYGDTITLDDFTIPKGIEVLDPEDTIYGSIKEPQAMPTETEEGAMEEPALVSEETVSEE